ncbi:MAG: NADH-quinone oxidoreductase subunit NuoG [Deltaproteobacteria bacterium]|nr:NADH-quinone oxidoreductase subunit NuoG [Deltaproteobacteria bacterium]
MAIWIDGRRHEADPERNILDVCLSRGLDLPYFCWHPALGSVGACRQCAVKVFKDDKDTRGRLAMACMTPAKDGTRLSIDDAEARELRRSVIEWLMLNHPHDCPVCDEGGECHLQDMTVMAGHLVRRTRFEKRTFRNQYLGPFVRHEMNRCIQCYRCVRFYADHAGGKDLGVFGAHDAVYFGRHADGVLESAFAGNLVEVCPTGVFTDRTLGRHYVRKWDLQTAPSVCVHCSLGCNTTPGERAGSLRRIRARYSGAVNGWFLCDRGRYGYEFVNSERRVRRPFVRGEAATSEVTPAALARAWSKGRVLGIGSPRASVESNYALAALVGPERFHQGTSAAQTALVATIIRILREGPARTPSLREVERCDAVLVLGEDVASTAPMLALALRQSVRRQPERAALELGIPGWQDGAVREVVGNRKGPLFIAASVANEARELDELATRTVRAAPEDVARLGFAVAHALDASAPEADGLFGRLPAQIAGALAGAERPLVVSGTGAGSEAVIQAAASVAWAAGAGRGRAAELVYVVPECNSLGAALIGGRSLAEAFAAMERGEVTGAIILENDLYRRAPEADVDAFLDRAGHVVVIDHLAHDTASRASTLLPAATFAESSGTFVNNEGRAQRFFQVFDPDSTDIRPSWRWIAALDGATDRWPNLDELQAALARELPIFGEIAAAGVPAEYRVRGARIPRALHRQSGRTAITANRELHEPRPPEDPDSPFAFSMEGAPRVPLARLAPEVWAPGWNSCQALNRFSAEIGGALLGGDPGVRLLEPIEGAPPAYFSPPRVDSLPEPPPDSLLVVALHHVFGSEELSALAPGVAELAPKPYVALGEEEALERGVSEREEVDLSIDGGPILTLPVRIRPGLPRGAVGLPAGPVRFVPAGSRARISKR